ncbi:MAG: hypothetical protein ACI8Z1_002759, partial [Candidatus Azotimanducaceae bacterium]
MVSHYDSFIPPTSEARSVTSISEHPAVVLPDASFLIEGS